MEKNEENSGRFFSQETVGQVLKHSIKNEQKILFVFVSRNCRSDLKTFPEKRPIFYRERKKVDFGPAKNIWLGKQTPRKPLFFELKKLPLAQEAL